MSSDQTLLSRCCGCQAAPGEERRSTDASDS
ncbi:hypothetical protein T08_10748, partial [Trichinella sp. T8]